MKNAYSDWREFRTTSRIQIGLLALSVLFIFGFTLAGSTADAQEQGPALTLYPRSGSTNVWQGTAISMRFDRSIDRQSLEEAFSIRPAADGYIHWHSDQQVEYRPNEPLLPTHNYELEIKATVRDSDGRQVLPEDYVSTFTTGEQRPEPRFGYGLPIQVLAPSGEHGLGLQPGFPRLTMDFTAYGLEITQFAEAYAAISGPNGGEIDVSQLQESETWTAHIDTSRSERGVALPNSLVAGLYVVEAAHPEFGSAKALLVYADHVTTLKRGRSGLAAWVTTHPDGKPLSGVSLQAYAKDGTPIGPAQVSSAEGLAGLGDIANEAAFVSASLNGHTSILAIDGAWRNHGYSWWWGWGWDRTYDPAPPTYTGHAHTDRPIYRPGHTVFYKSSLRKFTGDVTGLQVVDASTPISITLRDAKQNIVARHIGHADEFGSVSGEFELGDEVSLGNWTLGTEIDGEIQNTSFKVQEYVKPDFEVLLETDQSYYVRGQEVSLQVQGDYYFGQPAAGAEVTLRAYRGYWWRDESGMQPLVEISGQLDETGAWDAQFDLLDRWNLAQNYQEMITIEAEVVDASRRPVISTQFVPVHPADFTLRLVSERYGIELGQDIVLEAQTRDHLGGPFPDRDIKIELMQWRQAGQHVIATQQVRTGSDGLAEVRFSGQGTGWYSIRATAEDDAGRMVQQSGYSWIYSGDRPFYWHGGLEIIADRDAYEQGEIANILIKSPLTATALVTLERDEVYEEFIVEVEGATSIAIPLGAEHAPSVNVKVHMWQDQASPWSAKEGQLVTAEQVLRVRADEKRLDVEVEALDKEAQPGETTRLRLRVRDSAGQAVRAQLSLALVDKAIFALAADSSGDIFDAFWTRRGNAVRTYDSVQPSQTYDSIEEDADRGAGGGGALPPGNSADQENSSDDEASVVPRKEFRDTAFWKADLVTGPDGTVEVEVPLPDNLTTWRALARAISVDSRAGQGETEILVTKPIIADPALPRFAIQGDQFALDVLARNYASSENLGSSCALDTPGLIQLDAGTRSIDLPFNQTSLARWTVVASKIGENQVSATLETAMGSDAIELPFEVQPFAVPERSVTAGDTKNVAVESISVPYQAVPDASSIELRLAPSIAIGVLEGIEELIEYPYGCVEQTTSKVLPSAVVARLANKVQLDAPEITDELPRYMNLGLQKLYGFQNADGGWGWWHGEGNIYTTAYVLMAFQWSEAAGFEVSEDAMNRGLDWLAANLAAERDMRMRAFGAYILAEAGRDDLGVAKSIFRDRQAAKLDAFALGALALALDSQGDVESSSILVDELIASAETSETSAWWIMQRPWGGQWGMVSLALHGLGREEYGHGPRSAEQVASRE